MKFFIVKSKMAFLLLVILLSSFLLTLGNGNTAFANVFFGNSMKLYPIYKVETQKNEISITFDAAWGADKTREIMDVCDEYGIKATFFLVGIWVEEYPEITKEIAERDFEIGSHSYNHPDFTKLGIQEMQTELIRTNELIQKVAGIKPTLFRPPYGAYNNDLINTLNKLNMRGIQWDVDTLDWKGYGPNQVISRVNNKIDSGSIILCHNNAEHVVENTRLILTTLKNKGFNFVKVGELVKDVKEVKIGIGKL